MTKKESSSSDFDEILVNDTLAEEECFTDECDDFTWRKNEEDQIKWGDAIHGCTICTSFVNPY